MPRTHNEGRIVSSINNAGKIGYPCVKGITRLLSYMIDKNNSKWTKS